MLPFVALTLAALLATSGPDSLARIPGSAMSLGMPEARLKELGTWVEVKATDADGAITRKGDAKFFGVPCTATIYLRDGLLARVRFEAPSVPPHSASYVEDQLLRSKLLRECRRLEPKNHDCDWLGKVKIHLELQGDKLTATTDWPQRPWETEAEAPVAAATIAAPTVELSGAAALSAKLSGRAPATTPPPAVTPAKEHAAAESAPAKATPPAKPAETAPAKGAESVMAKSTETAPAKASVPAPAAEHPAEETASATKSASGAGLPLPTPPLKSAPATTLPVPATVVAKPSTPASAPAPATQAPPAATPPTPTPKAPAATSAPAPATIAPSKPAATPTKPAATTPAPAAGTVAGKAPMPPTAMLPETLRLSLPERNPPSVWPRMLVLPTLDYPEAARSRSLQGVVWVLALVDTAGEVRSTRIDRGIPGLNEAALAWVAKAHFAPCVREGATLAFWIRVAVRFTLS